MVVGVNGLSRRRSLEQFPYLGVTLCLGPLGEGQVFPVCLALAREGRGQVLFTLVHIDH